MSPSTIHVFIVNFPTQGQINPLLCLAKSLASYGGFLATFSITATAGQKIMTANDITRGHLYPVGDGFIRFEFYDIDSPFISQFNQFPVFNSKLELGSRKCSPVTCLISGAVVPWVFDIPDELGIPLATMWAQSCASFLTFYYFYNQLAPFPTEDDPYTDVEIPTLPLLKWDELHSFLHPAYPIPDVRTAWLREFGNLNKSFCILIDTFDELERDIIEFAPKLCPSIKPIGPLFRNPNAPISANSYKADSGCLDWLDSKPPRSLVYVCFGSIAHIKQEQVDEIAHRILNTGAPFLWVMRPTEPGSNLKAHALPEEVGPDDGMVVEYSPQERVLAHPSLACFVTHCG
ncbi:hypothetical protein V2J09_018388 [Rumex salicifolius]